VVEVEVVVVVVMVMVVMEKTMGVVMVVRMAAAEMAG
jgi:hypothetical protein